MRVGIVVTVLGVLLVSLLVAPTTAASEHRLQIKVLSNHADLISGGDALVEIVVPTSADASKVRVDLNGRDVTDAFGLPSGGRLIGLVEGLTNGANSLTARGGAGASRITITNHPRGGPVFAGPQVQPWVCGTTEFGLGPATDAQCNAPTRYFFSYKNAVTGQFHTYDPDDPPPDRLVDRTTTDQGKTVRYIVRNERGTADRGLYQVSVLYDPARLDSPPAWNHKLVVPFGGGADPYHTQEPPSAEVDVLVRDMALSRGFMVASSGLHKQGYNTNAVVSAEALMMLKEHIIERYGLLRYTIGAGCSGGSIHQYQIASRYPGLLDGLLPNCSYPDTWTTATTVFDCRLLAHYFTETSPHLWPIAAQRGPVEGHENTTSCRAWDLLFGSSQDPTDASNCNLPQGQVYHPQRNPDGVRCTVSDYEVAIWGRRAQDGFGKLPYDNVGVQYGLNALNSGLISPNQFVDLNTKIGGYDIDWNFVSTRREMQPGTADIAYRVGAVTDARQLARVPIIDLRGYVGDTEVHTSFHSYKMQAKLDRDNGHHRNHAIWTFPSPLLPTPKIARTSFLTMDRWLSNIEKDLTGTPLADKVVANKPARAVDSCWIDNRQIINDALCRITFPHFGVPRTAAGGPTANDIVKCQLKPLDRNDYNATFTGTQWRQLHKAFPSGVCDWSRPGTGRQPSTPWMSFTDGPGGRPLGAPATSTAVG